MNTTRSAPRLSIRLESFLTQPRFTYSLLLLAILLTSPALFVGLQFDDYLQRTTLTTAPSPVVAINNLFVFMDGNPAHTQQKMAAGLFPWYSLPTGQVSFWRPLTAVTHWLDYALWPNEPWLMHVQSLVWYLVLALAVVALYRHLLRSSGTITFWSHILLANLAALLYVLDDARGFAVGWLSNRNGIVSALFGLLALLAFHRWRHAKWRPGLFLTITCFGLALLAGESGIATLAYLFAYSFFLDQAPRFQRLLTLVPSIVLLLIWRIAYVVLGYSAWGTSYIDPGREPFRFMQGIMERVPLLLLGQWALPPAELYPLFVPPASTIYWFAAVTITAGLTVLFWPLFRQNALARFFAVGMILATVPSAASLPANRLLFFIGFGAFGLLVLYLDFSFHTLKGSFHRICARLLLVLNILQIPLLPLTTFSPFLLGNIEPSIASLPTDTSFAQQTAVFLNAPSHFYIAFIPDIRRLTTQPFPARVLFLAPGLTTTTLTRTNPNTLIAEPQSGYLTGFDAVFRDSSQPLRLNQHILLPEVDVEVLALTPDQRPSQVAFRFTTPLEDSSLRWLEWRRGIYIPYSPPAVGQTRSLPPVFSWP